MTSSGSVTPNFLNRSLINADFLVGIFPAPGEALNFKEFSQYFGFINVSRLTKNSCALKFDQVSQPVFFNFNCFDRLEVFRIETQAVCGWSKVAGSGEQYILRVITVFVHPFAD